MLAPGAGATSSKRIHSGPSPETIQYAVDFGMILIPPAGVAFTENRPQWAMGPPRLPLRRRKSLPHGSRLTIKLLLVQNPIRSFRQVTRHRSRRFAVHARPRSHPFVQLHDKALLPLLAIAVRGDDVGGLDVSPAQIHIAIRWTPILTFPVGALACAGHQPGIAGQMAGRGKAPHVADLQRLHRAQ